MMDGPKFQFFVINEDVNNKKMINYNIFNNSRVYETTLKEVKKYVRNPKKYKYRTFNFSETTSDKYIYGFDGFCEQLRSILMNQEWSRCEYEIIVSPLIVTETYKYEEKWDCFMQAEPNIEIIAREVIYQYKEWKKNYDN